MKTKIVLGSVVLSLAVLLITTKHHTAPGIPPDLRDAPISAVGQLQNSAPNAGSSFSAVPIVGPGVEAAVDRATDFPQSCRLMIYPDIKPADLYHCSATIISETRAITAAHCAIKQQSQKVNTTLFCGRKERQYTGVLNRPPDSQFSDEAITGTSISSDYAFVVLAGNQKFRAKPAPFASRTQWEKFSDFKTSDCRIVGWGRDNSGNSGTLNSAKVSEIAIPHDYPKIITVGYTGRDENSVASGDSGGALMCRDNTKWYLLGVVSVGPPNGEAGSAFMVNTLDWKNE